MKNILYLLFAVATVFASCTEKFEDKSIHEEAELQAYLKENNITVEPTASGLYYISESATGEVEDLEGNYIHIKYSAWLTNGKRIVKAQELKHQVGQARYLNNVNVFEGLNEGFKLLRKGEIATLIIPSNLAYGSLSSGNIPAYSTIIYKLEVVSIDLESDEVIAISEYIAANGGFGEQTEEGIYVFKTLEVEDTAGDNPYPEEDQEVTVSYKGYYMSGEVFDAGGSDLSFKNSDDQTSVVPGFAAAVKELRIGEKATVLIPSEFAYGSDGNTTIDPFTPLLFDLERIK